MTANSLLAKGVVTALLVLGSIIFLFPLVWMVLASLETPAETMRTPPVWFPATPNLNAYGQVAGVIDAGRSFINSAIVATVTTAGMTRASGAPWPAHWVA